MDEQQAGNSQADTEVQPAGESTDAGELEGLLPLLNEEGEEVAAEAAAPEGEQAEAEGDEPPAPALTDDTEVALDDGRKVKVREMKETFATFTRKTQELAETQRATVTQAREAIARIAEQRANEMNLLSGQIEQLVAPGYDQAALMQLASTDPTQFFAIKARLDMAREVQTNIRQQAAALLQQAQQQREQAEQESAQSRDQLLAAEGQKLSGQKWWNTDFQTKAVAFAKKHGVPEQVARSVAYAGFVEITRKAMLYDEAMARTKGGKQLPTQPAARPGATPARGQMQKVKQVSNAYETASKTRDRGDIGRFLDQVL